MKKYWHSVITLALAVFLIITVPTWAGSQENSTPSSTGVGIPVVLENKTLFTIQESFGSMSPEQRSQKITDNVTSFAQEASIPVDSLQVGDQNGLTVIFSGEKVIATITEADAKAASTTPQELAYEYVQKFKDAVSQYRKHYGLREGTTAVGFGKWIQQTFRYASSLTVHNQRFSYSRAISFTLVATIILIILLFVLNITFPRLYTALNSQRNKGISALSIRSLPILSSDGVTDILLSLTKTIHSIVTFIIFSIYIILILSFFPATRQVGTKGINYLVSVFNQAGKAFLNYLPNLFVIVLIIFITSYILGLLKPVFTELGKGTISFPGFYPEWARPTYRLVEFFIIAMAGVMVFPYLPGFGSAAFQNVSIFVGVLISLGSTSAVSNAVAGIILIYTRAFQIGDEVQLGTNDTKIKGKIEEKSLIVTRIRTENNIIVTIPNSSLLSSSIVNYSTSIRDTNIPVRLVTTVNFSYDVPWQTVYQIITDAARLIPDVLEEPGPNVLQIQLGDTSVTYEIGVYTNDPSNDSNIFSELHSNIRDKCNAAGIEILSPQYSAVRDGNNLAIPKDYLPKDYTPAGFQLHPLGNLFQLDLHWGAANKKGNTNNTPNPSKKVQPNQQQPPS